MPEWLGDVKWSKEWGVPEVLICCTEIPIEKGALLIVNIIAPLLAFFVSEA